MVHPVKFGVGGPHNRLTKAVLASLKAFRAMAHSPRTVGSTLGTSIDAIPSVSVQPLRNMVGTAYSSVMTDTGGWQFAVGTPSILASWSLTVLSYAYAVVESYRSGVKSVAYATDLSDLLEGEERHYLIDEDDWLVIDQNVFTYYGDPANWGDPPNVFLDAHYSQGVANKMLGVGLIAASGAVAYPHVLAEPSSFSSWDASLRDDFYCGAAVEGIVSHLSMATLLPSEAEAWGEAAVIEEGWLVDREAVYDTYKADTVSSLTSILSVLSLPEEEQPTASALLASLALPTEVSAVLPGSGPVLLYLSFYTTALESTAIEDGPEALFVLRADAVSSLYMYDPENEYDLWPTDYEYGIPAFLFPSTDAYTDLLGEGAYTGVVVKLSVTGGKVSAVDCFLDDTTGWSTALDTAELLTYLSLCGDLVVVRSSSQFPEPAVFFNDRSIQKGNWGLFTTKAGEDAEGLDGPVAAVLATDFLTYYENAWASTMFYPPALASVSPTEEEARRVFSLFPVDTLESFFNTYTVGMELAFSVASGWEQSATLSSWSKTKSVAKYQDFQYYNDQYVTTYVEVETVDVYARLALRNGFVSCPTVTVQDSSEWRHQGTVDAVFAGVTGGHSSGTPADSSANVLAHSNSSTDFSQLDLSPASASGFLEVSAVYAVSAECEDGILGAGSRNPLVAWTNCTGDKYERMRSFAKEYAELSLSSTGEVTEAMAHVSAVMVGVGSAGTQVPVGHNDTAVMSTRSTAVAAVSNGSALSAYTYPVVPLVGDYLPRYHTGLGDTTPTAGIGVVSLGAVKPLFCNLQPSEDALPVIQPAVYVGQTTPVRTEILNEAEEVVEIHFTSSYRWFIGTTMVYELEFVAKTYTNTDTEAYNIADMEALLLSKQADILAAYEAGVENYIF